MTEEAATPHTTRELVQADLSQRSLDELGVMARKQQQVLERLVLGQATAQGMPPNHPMGGVFVDHAMFEGQLGGLTLLLIRKGVITEAEAAASVVEGFMWQVANVKQAAKDRPRIVVPG